MVQEQQAAGQPETNDATSPDRIGDSFRWLQSQLIDRWRVIDHFDGEDCDIVVIPSLSLDHQEVQKITGINHYEERLLFSLIRLRNPRTRVIYVTSLPISETIIDYYLQLLPGVPFSHARDRLLLLTAYDSSSLCLSQKLLDRPRLLARIRRALRPERSYMVCFNSTALERELSVRLGVPLWACDPDLLWWGTKAGSRQVFAEAGLPHPDGSLALWTVADLAEATAELWQRQPDLEQVVLKLNEGFSGQGNAVLDLRSLAALAPQSGVRSAERRAGLVAAFASPALRFQAPGETWATYQARIPEMGAIVEAFVAGPEKLKRSPSVQGRIWPGGQVEILSTHDQILGGPDRQTFIGCRFPADGAYRLDLQAAGLAVGQVLAAKGCLERFGVDFVALKQPNQPLRDRWQLQAIEINLRKGGTTHPFATLKYLTGGRYCLEDGTFRTASGQTRSYIASDNLKQDRYRGWSAHDLIDIIAIDRLHFDSGREMGTVFHMIGALSEFGKLGLTCIGDSPKTAQAEYDRAVAALDAASEKPIHGPF